MTDRESTFTQMPGGCSNTQFTGANRDGGVNINPNMTGREGCVEVHADGRVIDRGATKFNTANLPKTGPTFYSENGAKRVYGRDVTKSSVVEIGGIKTTVGAALQAGLLTADSLGNYSDSSEKAKEQMADKGEDKGEAPVSFASDAANGMLNALDEAIGRDGTMAVASSVIGHITSDRWATTEEAFAKAGQSLAQRSGVDPEVAQQAVIEAYDGYKAQCSAFLKRNGENPDQVWAFAETCSAEVKADLMRRIVLGQGAQALKALVNRMRTRQRR